MLSAADEKITLRVQNLVVIFVVFFVSLMFSSFTTILLFSQHSAMAQTSVKLFNSATTTSNNWPTYENDTIGIKKLQYPQNWKKIDEDKSTIRFSPLLENKTGSPIANFSIQALSSQNVALEDRVSLDLIKYRQSFTDFKLNESHAVRLADNSAYKVVFQYNKGGPNSFKAMQFWTIIGDRTFVIKYTSRLDKYLDYLPEVQLMIDSLKIQGTHIAGLGEINRLGLLGQRIGSDPYYITMNTITKKIYMANYRYDTVSVIDSSNDRVVATVKVGDCPDAIDINEVTNRIYVANDCSNTVSVIDGATNEVVGPPIGVGTNPEDVAVDQKEGGFNSLIFIANYGSNTVSVIDGATNKVVGTIGVGDKPGALAVNQIINRLYVVNSDSDRVDVIDYFSMKKGGSFKPSVIANITVGSFPDAVYLNSDVNMLYVSNRHSNTISVINGTTNKVVGPPIGVGSAPYYLDGNPTTNKIYVANYGSNTVSVIDGTTNKVVANITVGYLPYDLHVDLSYNIIYVTNLGSNTVSEINGTTNKILVGITFSLEPKDGGYIQCNRLYGSNLYVRDEIGKDLNCEAIPAANYRFSSWSGSMTSNLDVNNPKIKLNASRYGILTSHFVVPVNISIPPEYFLSLYGIVLGIILPPLIGLYFVRRARKNLGKYMKKIDKVYDSLRQDEAKSSHRLIRIREDIIEALEKGNINESHYSILENRISKYLDELSKSK
jgi:YVTN family beta-propeller protein